MWNKQWAVRFVILTMALLVITGCTFQIDPETAREAQNKAVVSRVVDELFGQGNVPVVDELFSENYIQHNPMVPNGPEGLKGFVEAMAAQGQALNLTPKHILADGDLVVVHSHASPTPEDEFSGLALIDIFRLDDGVIVEHWDVIQEVPAESASGNSMFSDLYEYAGDRPKLSEAQEEANEQLVLDAYNGLFNEHQVELLDQFWAGEAYLQHNPLAPNGTAALGELLDVFAPEGALSRFVHSAADGDLVFTHVQALPPGADPEDEFTGMAIGDIFRIVDGKIVEHWDVLQPVPAETASGNSMFSDLYEGED